MADYNIVMACQLKLIPLYKRTFWQVPHPFAVVEDILTRLTLLDAELDEHLGPPPQEAVAGEDACLPARRTRRSAEFQEASYLGSSTIPIGCRLLYCHIWAP